MCKKDVVQWSTIQWQKNNHILKFANKWSELEKNHPADPERQIQY